MSDLDLTLDDGTYRVLWNEREFRAERHGAPWRNLSGDALVLSLALEVARLRARVREVEAAREKQEHELNAAADGKIAALEAFLEAETQARLAAVAHVRRDALRGNEKARAVLRLAEEHLARAFSPALRRYRHFRGGTYRELHRGALAGPETPVVVYRSEADGRVWVRNAGEFDGEVRPGARRFEPLP